MIAVIRISGMVDVPYNIEETLKRIRLRRKYSAVIIKPNPQNLKILKKIRNFIAYGDIDKKTLSLLVESRGVPKDKKKKINPKEILEQIEKKDPKSWDIKPFFRLHPPRGGIDSKKHFGVTKRAVLGDNKNHINDLVRRML